MIAAVDHDAWCSHSAGRSSGVCCDVLIYGLESAHGMLLHLLS
jgi:hypothetical protein